MFQTKFVEKIKTRFTVNNFFFFLENHAGYEIIWKNTVKSGRPQVTIWRMRIAYWIPKATNTLSEHVILIGFPLQQSLHELTSVIRCTYIACFVSCLYLEQNSKQMMYEP
jgi:hypothetical protein